VCITWERQIQQQPVMAFVFCITLLIPVFASTAAGLRRRNAAASLLSKNSLRSF
jgi:hypothetical protein